MIIKILTCQLRTAPICKHQVHVANALISVLLSYKYLYMVRIMHPLNTQLRKLYLEIDGEKNTYTQELRMELQSTDQYK